MSTDATPYAYKAPFIPAKHPDQRYYRRGDGISREFDTGHEGVNGNARLFRFKDDLDANLTLELASDKLAIAASLSVALAPAAMLRLRDALNDALTDIAAAQEQLARQQSLDELMEEMRNNPDGQRDVYIVHPDVHYVAPGQTEAKLAQLSGQPCIIIEDAEMAGLLARASAGCTTDTPAPTAALACL